MREPVLVLVIAKFKSWELDWVERTIRPVASEKESRLSPEPVQVPEVRRPLWRESSGVSSGCGLCLPRRTMGNRGRRMAHIGEFALGALGGASGAGPGGVLESPGGIFSRQISFRR